MASVLPGRLTQRAVAARSRISQQTIVIALTIAGSVFLALLVEAVRDGMGPLARPEFSLITSLPIAVYPALLLAASAAVLVRNHWWLGLGLFFVWLPFEDLVRKFTGNDLRVYFVKDAILVVALLGVLPHLRGTWRKPLGEAWLPTLVVFAFAAVMSLPSAVHGPTIPFLAFHTRFLFAVLFPVGVYIAQDRDRLERAMLGLGVLTAVVSALGIVQAVVGPKFLNPALDTSPFAHLTVTKTAGSVTVLRPSGPFADVSRFASWTIISVVVALCALRLASTPRRRRISLAFVAIGVGASFASASRAAFLVTVPLVIFSVAFPPPGARRIRVRTLAAVLAILVVGTTAGGRIGRVYRATSGFFAVTINPFSSGFELGSRAWSYAQGVEVGVSDSHWLGVGTGTESLATRYVETDVTASHVESGWGSVGSEWGLAGLVGWVIWVVAWSRRAIQLRGRSPTTRAIAPVVAAYLIAYLVALFSLGIGFFENYVGNSFFWLLSGVAFAPAATEYE